MKLQTNKPIVIKGKLVASTTPRNLALSNTFNIEVLYSRNPIGFITKSIKIKDKDNQ